MLLHVVTPIDQPALLACCTGTYTDFVPSLETAEYPKLEPFTYARIAVPYEACR